MLAESGMSNPQIAAATGYTHARVSVILNSQNRELIELRAGFAAQVADNILDTNLRFKLYANEMLDVMVWHARQKKDRPETSRLAARDILQMAGFTPIKRELQLRANVPVEALQKVVEKLAEANEVVAQSGEWVVRNVPATAGK